MLNAKCILTWSTADPKWPNASLSYRCRIAGSKKRWISWTSLPDPGQPLCADGWGNLPVLLRRVAWLWLGRRGNGWGGKGRRRHRRGRWCRCFTCWRRYSIRRNRKSGLLDKILQKAPSKSCNAVWIRWEITTFINFKWLQEKLIKLCSWYLMWMHSMGEGKSAVCWMKVCQPLYGHANTQDCQRCWWHSWSKL